MRTVLRPASTALLIALLAGCAASPRLASRPGLAVVNATALPAPEAHDITGAQRPYLVGPFDRLTIDVYGVPELSQREVQVDEGGAIAFPLAGQIPVAGMTAREIALSLATRLAEKYMRDPQVSVTVKQTGNQVVTVEGEVKKPGLFPVVGRMTLLQAMALAGGTTELAKLDDVVLFREVKGERYAALYNLSAIRHGVYADPEVFANDTVVVGDSKARRLFKDLMTITPLLTAPVILLDRLGTP